jgi:hypothetical protein
MTWDDSNGTAELPQLIRSGAAGRFFLRSPFDHEAFRQRFPAGVKDFGNTVREAVGAIPKKEFISGSVFSGVGAFPFDGPVRLASALQFSFC